VEVRVEKGLIAGGRCYSDCLLPGLIDELNTLLDSGKVPYDERGADIIGEGLLEKFQGNDIVTGKYIPELVQWIKQAI
jgi:hypothetical protein